MNQLCRVCGEPAAGFHFGAFTCEGCKSFFGRTYNNLSQIHECKNGGSCVINKQNRTSCKACRLKKCVFVGMSKSGSRYGRRSNWFKIHCLLQEQAAQVSKSFENAGGAQRSLDGSPTPVTSLSPSQLPSLSPGRTEDETKVEGSSLSSPESVVSESSVDIHRRHHINGALISQRDNVGKEGLPGSDFVANLGLYSLHPGLSLLHASHFYSRLYPPVLYPALTQPHILATPPTPTPSLPLTNSPPHSLTSPRYNVSISRPSSSSSESSSRAQPPSPPCSIQTTAPSPNLLFPHRKRGADSPVEENLRNWIAPSTEQEAPIDLRVKRRRISTHSIHSPGGYDSPPPTDDKPTSMMNLLPLAAIASTPVNLSSKA